jgi:cytochrome c oxidase cbb3-type subunit 2
VDAKRFYPRPRDLTLGVYKFRSTASGTPPTDDDLFRTMTHGLPGSNMPDWQHLDERTRWQLVDYLKTLSPVFEQAIPTPVSVAADPGPSRADLAKGRAVYEQLGCAACHGSAGRANGTSAAGLVDDWGMPIRPANLTQGWSFRGGSEPRDVVLRVLTGIDGAGMPSYAEAVSTEDAWHLAYYVASLQEPAHWNPIARAVHLAAPAPSGLADPRWPLVERTDVPVRNAVSPDGAWQSPPTVQAVSVQVISTDDAVTFRFSWDDPTKDVDPPVDGLALLLKPAGREGDVVTLQAWPYAGAPALDICYWSAEDYPIIEHVAADFQGVVARADPQPAILKGASAYADGRWSIVLQRPLHPQSPDGAAALSPGSLVAIAVMVWDGGNPTARAVSPWLDVALERGRRYAGAH